MAGCLFSVVERCQCIWIEKQKGGGTKSWSILSKAMLLGGSRQHCFQYFQRNPKTEVILAILHINIFFFFAVNTGMKHLLCRVAAG